MAEKSRKNVTNIPAVAKAPAPDGKRLHAFTSMPSSVATILGPRRVPAVKSSAGNGDSYVQIFTSNGFQPLTNADYIAAIETLKPDIAIPLADMHYAAAMRTPQAKGLRRMCERTEDWMADLHAALDPARLRASATSLFAPTLPAPYPIQWEYLDRLAGDLRDKLSGLAVYDVDLLPDLIPNYPSLRDLPRLSLDAAAGPHEVLRQIALGADVLLLPFINATSDAGVAMTFTFPPPSPTTTTTTTTQDGTDLLPLGTDLTDPEHATSLAPLADDCPCHACAAHHRAYLRHLLDAREMLAWALLQVHNHHVASRLLAGARASLARGTFDEDRRRFHRAYEADLPPGCGARPRARGYHFKSEGGDERRNKVTWQLLKEGQGGLEAAEAVEERLARGGMDTPVVPAEDVGAEELVRDGLGEVAMGGTR